MPNELLDFIVGSSLYQKYNIGNREELVHLLRICELTDRFEMFCPVCGEKRVFLFDAGVHESTIRSLSNHLRGMTSSRCDIFDNYNSMYFRFACSMDESHTLEYFFAKKGDTIIKVGQYPSSADIDLPQAGKYKKILGEDYYKEFKRSIGLYSHGGGIGSFVYLRRIIEKLVFDAFKEAEQASALTEQQFLYQSDGQHRNGIEEKIKLLKGYLPDLITESPQIYGVVSKGIHELSEEECLGYYPVLKGGITLILDEIVAKKDKERAAEEYKRSFGKILSGLKQK